MPTDSNLLLYYPSLTKEGDVLEVWTALPRNTDLIAGGTSHPLLAALTIYTLPCLELSRLAQPPALIITIPLSMLSLTSRTVIKLNYLASRMTARAAMPWLSEHYHPGYLLEE